MTTIFNPAESDAPVRRVLVVGRDYGSRTICARMLTRAGFAVSEAESGQAACDTLQADGYELVITDHLMPDCTGFELAQRMRRAGMSQPVIVISESKESPGRVADSESQIVVVLAKPFSFYELLIRVNAALDSFPAAETRHVRGRIEKRSVDVRSGGLGADHDLARRI